MTEAELLAQAAAHARAATMGAAEWVARARDPKYPWRTTHWGKALLSLDQLREKPPAPPKPPPAPASPYGTAVDAAPFAGRGIMLGSNRDVWGQARELAESGHLEVVAVIPSTPPLARQVFVGLGAKVVVWCPPELPPTGDIAQAESQAEWNANTNHGEQGVCCNSWTYGKFNNRVALVEVYYNEGWGVDFGIFRNYMAQGARAVIPVCGGYSARGRSDAESARLYASLSISVDTPGFWMYAGESMLTDESVAVLKAWKP